MPKYAVTFKPSADKALKRLPSAVQRRIAERVVQLSTDPRPPDGSKLTGMDDLWRIRVGSYRVVYAIRDEELVIVIVRVAHRKDVYRDH